MAPSPAVAAEKVRQWERDGFIISTDKSLISLPALNQALDSDIIYWANGLPEDELRILVDYSICFGVYSPTSSSLPPASQVDDATLTTTPPDPADTLHEVAERVHTNSNNSTTGHGQGAEDAVSRSSEGQQQQPALIGFARLISDHVSVAYLTDLYILPEWQNQGLGSWLVDCVREYTNAMPRLRAVVLVADEGRMEAYYAKKLGTRRLEDVSPGNRLVFAKGPGSSL